VPKRYKIPEEIRYLLPDSLFDLIDAREQLIKGEILEKIEKLIKNATDVLVERMHQRRYVNETIKLESPNPRRLCNCSYISMLVKNLSNFGLWPISNAMMNLSLLGICHALTKPALLQAIPVLFTNGMYEAELCPACKRGFQSQLRIILERTWLSYKGLCLDCFNGSPLQSVKRCRREKAWHFDREAA